jgi:hypothetical protein
MLYEGVMYEGVKSLYEEVKSLYEEVKSLSIGKTLPRLMKAYS